MSAHLSKNQKITAF